MDISALWKAQTYEQHSLISYSKHKMQTERTWEEDAEGND